jgi:hypothetical protein
MEPFEVSNNSEISDQVFNGKIYATVRDWTYNIDVRNVNKGKVVSVLN